MAVLFDTLKLAERLEAAGMPPEQAKGTAAALAEGLTNTVATAADIDTVRGEIREVELRLRGEITALRGEVHEIELRLRGEITALRGEVHEAEARLRGEITELRGEMHEAEARLRTEIEKVRSDVRGWLVTQAFAIIGAVGVLVGLAAALSRLIH